MTRSTEKQLTREQQVAISAFMSNRSSMQHILNSSKYFGKNDPIPSTDFVTASYHPYQISKFPREHHWCWNQSNAKVCVKLDDTTIITLRKVSPRSRIFQGGVPSYKLWLFCIESTLMPEYNFIWCEKGIEETNKVVQVNDVNRHDIGISTEIGTIFPSLISIESLSFLLPFVNENLACELGWK